MLSPKKKNRQTRRYVCTCLEYECSSGRYIDANGVSCRGVELSPEAFEAHQRAQLRHQAQANSAKSTINTSHPSQSAHQTGPSSENDLISRLKQVVLSPTRPSRLSDIPSGSSHDQLPEVGSLRPSESTHDGLLSTASHESTSAVHDGDTSKDCLAMIRARKSGMQPYNCAQFFTFDLKFINPLHLHVVLAAALMNVYSHVSNKGTSWLLDVQRANIRLSLTHGLKPTSSPTELLPYDDEIIHPLPRTSATVFEWLQVDPSLTYMNCCLSCFALYPLESAPPTCNHRLSSIPGGPPESMDLDSDFLAASNDNYTPDFTARVCGEVLLRSARGGQRPVRRYAFQSFPDWIARFLSRPGVESLLDESLEESSKEFDTHDAIQDIHQSKIWKESRGPDGEQFTSTSGNLTFGMFVDGINPFGNKQSGRHVSITFIVLVCLTLPIRVRYRPENIFLVGIVPGPREPSLEQMNWVLRPLVSQLQSLWNPGLLLSRTHRHKNGRLIRAALLPFLADIPALRRSLGFPSATARYFCSMCLLTKDQAKNFDQSSWPPRTTCQHKIWAYEARDAETVKDREDIFKTHGVRYSVLVDLEYWDIIHFVVVDSMHNLLLGLLAWHCRRFWAMKEVVNEEDNVPSISTSKLLNLLSEHSNPQPASYSKDHPGVELKNEDDCQSEMSLLENTDSSDEDFNPLGEGWSGRWEPPPVDQIVFDSAMFSDINSLLPHIHIPSWIKRAIPVLGKASFGKLKADEWRNLLTIQLPLILIQMWYGYDEVKNSLLKNFCHLVSLVNLALKRVMTSEIISSYRDHIRQYLESSVILFDHCQPTCNHHLAIHLADCLQNFGPVRSWWSFPFERLMGNILKSCHNNHLGELEITFMKSFSRAGNLASILQDENLPEALKPYVSQLKALYEPSERLGRRASNSKMEAIEPEVLELLTKRLNSQRQEDCRWVTPEKWASMSKQSSLGFAPVSARALVYNQVTHLDVNFSTFKASRKDSFILFKSLHKGQRCFGRIQKIFVHRRNPEPKKIIKDTWLYVHSFRQLSPDQYNPFAKINEPNVQAELRLWDMPESVLVRLDQVVAHCAWMMYSPGSIHRSLKVSTVALLSMER